MSHHQFTFLKLIINGRKLFSVFQMWLKGNNKFTQNKGEESLSGDPKEMAGSTSDVLKKPYTICGLPLCRWFLISVGLCVITTAALIIIVLGMLML